MGQARSLGAQNEADQTLQFLLDSADKAAADRQFRVNTGLSLYGQDQSALESALSRQFSRASAQEGFGFQSEQSGLQRDFEAQEAEKARQFEQQQIDRYMATLAQQQAEERKSRKKSGIGSAIGSIGGGILGGFATGWSPWGIAAGSQVGGSLGFLFS